MSQLNAADICQRLRRSYLDLSPGTCKTLADFIAEHGWEKLDELDERDPNLKREPSLLDAVQEVARKFRELQNQDNWRAFRIREMLRDHYVRTIDDIWHLADQAEPGAYPEDPEDPLDAGVGVWVLRCTGEPENPDQPRNGPREVSAHLVDPDKFCKRCELKRDEASRS